MRMTLFAGIATAMALVLASEAAANLGVYVSVTVTTAPTVKGQARPVGPGVPVQLITPSGRTLTGFTDANGKVLFANLDRRTRPTDYLVRVRYANQTQTARGHHVTFKFVVPR